MTRRGRCGSFCTFWPAFVVLTGCCFSPSNRFIGEFSTEWSGAVSGPKQLAKHSALAVTYYRGPGHAVLSLFLRSHRSATAMQSSSRAGTKTLLSQPQANSARLTQKCDMIFSSARNRISCQETSDVGQDPSATLGTGHFPVSCPRDRQTPAACDEHWSRDKTDRHRRAEVGR